MRGSLALLVLLLTPVVAFAQGAVITRGSPTYYAHPDVVKFTVPATTIELNVTGAQTAVSGAARIFIRNNPANGKQQLCVQFSTGAVQCPSSEP